MSIMSEVTDTNKSNGVMVGHASPDKIPWRDLGDFKYRVLENGSRTQSRLAITESVMAPFSDGTPFCLHKKHEEGFYVTKGKLRFQIPGQPDLNLGASGLVIIPIGVPYSFSNPFDEQAVFINTFTPSFFVQYFENVEKIMKSESHHSQLSPEQQMAELMDRFDSIQLTTEMLKQHEANDRSAS